MHKHYAVAGINNFKCDYCGRDKYGRPKTNGGNVFISLPLKEYAALRHDCELQYSGECHKCGRKTTAKFIHQLAPKASEEAIRRMQRFLED